MHYQSTVFGQLLKALPRGWFERQAVAYRQGRAKRRLSEWGHLVAMVLAQLGGSRSLRDLERYLGHHPGVINHLGIGCVKRSTLADANADRPAALFEAVAAKLAADQPRRGLGKEALRLIDATRIFAGQTVAAWAGGGVKLHLALEAKTALPTWFAVTSERVNDITPAKAMPVETGATYVFDKGYYDFSFWARIDAAGSRFVTRLKNNSPVAILKERSVPTGQLLFDRLVSLSERLSSTRRNPYQKPIRLVGVRIDTGRQLVLVTNDLTAPAAEIAELYKARWQIELFFKWIKQNLKLARFLGTSRNAVTIQIMAALIAYLLMRAAILRHKASAGLLALARILPALALARRPLKTILDPPPTPPDQAQTPQLAFALA
jgi:hypothetical protein